MTARVIGLVGKKGSGKTTVAKYLVDEYNFEEVVFAEPVKRVTESIFGFSYDMLLGDTKEKRQQRVTLKDPIWGKTPVEAMQIVGTEIFRNGFDSETWIKIAKRKVDQFRSEGKSVVISDVRFENEINFIRETGGEIVVLFEKPEDITPPNLANINAIKSRIEMNSSGKQELSVPLEFGDNISPIELIEKWETISQQSVYRNLTENEIKSFLMATHASEISFQNGIESSDVKIQNTKNGVDKLKEIIDQHLFA